MSGLVEGRDGEQSDRQTLVEDVVDYSPFAIVLTDPRLDDNPITYVNDAFQKLTLYSREFALGRNCRFLQGPETTDEDIQRIREGLQSGEEFQATITNHKADGTAFRNQLLIAPIRGSNGELNAYFSVQRSVDDEPEAAVASRDGSMDLLHELQHRVKNHLAMVVSMIRVQAKQPVTPDSLKAIGRRIEALALLYEELLRPGGNGNGTRQIAAGAYLSRIASVISSLQARGAIRVNVEVEDISLQVDQAARLGLILSEIVTNALEHAFKGRSAGVVVVRFFRLSDGGIRLSIEDDGIGMPGGSNWPKGSASIEKQHERAEQNDGQLDTTGHGAEPGVGGSIVTALAQSLGASLHVASPERGTIITVDFSPDTK